MSHHRSTQRSAPQVSQAAHTPSRSRQNVQSHSTAHGQEVEHATASPRRILRHTGSNVTDVSLRVQSVKDALAPPAYSSPMRRRPAVDTAPVNDPTTDASNRGEQNHQTATRTRTDTRTTPHSNRTVEQEHVAQAADAESPYTHAYAQSVPDCDSPVCRLEKGVYMRLLMDIYGVRAHAGCRCDQATESDLSELGERHYGRDSIDRVSAADNKERDGDEACGDSDAESEVSTSSTDAVVSAAPHSSTARSRLKIHISATMRTGTRSPVLEGSTLTPESPFNGVADTKGKSRQCTPVQMDNETARSPNTQTIHIPVHASPASSSNQHDKPAEVHEEKDAQKSEPQNITESAIPADVPYHVPNNGQDEPGSVSTPDSHTFQTCHDDQPEEIATEGVCGVPFASEQSPLPTASTTFAFLPMRTSAYANPDIPSAAGSAAPAYTFIVPTATGSAYADGSSIPQVFYVPFGTSPAPASSCPCGCDHDPAASSPGWSLHPNDGTLVHRDVRYKVSGLIEKYQLVREYLAVESRDRSGAHRSGDADDDAQGQGRVVGLHVMDKPVIYGEPNARHSRLRMHRMMTRFKQDGRKWLRGVERSWSDELNVFYVRDALPCRLDEWIKSSHAEDVPFRIYVAEMILVLCELQASAIVHRSVHPVSIGVGLTGHLRLDCFDTAVIREELEDAPEYFPSGASVLYTPPEVFAHCRCDPNDLVRLASDMAPAAVSDTYDVWCMAICILEMFWPGPQPLLYDEALSRLSGEEFCARLASPDLDRLPVMRYLSNRHPTLLDLVHKMTSTDPTKRWTPDRLKTHAFFDGVDWEEIERQNSLPRCPVIERHAEAAESPLYSGQLDEAGQLPLHPEALRGILEDAESDGDVWEWWPVLGSDTTFKSLR